MANSLSVYIITENIYYSQLSSVAIHLQPEPNCLTSYNTRKKIVLSLPNCLTSYNTRKKIVLSLPKSYRLAVFPSHVSTYNGQRSSQLFCVYYTFEFHEQ
jgi:hypothetical protein